MATRRNKDTFLYRIAAENKASKAIRGVKREFAGLRTATFETFGSFAFGIDLAKGLATAVQGLARAMAEPIELAIEQERVVRQLGTVLKSTGFAAGVTSKEIQQLGAELARSTTFTNQASIDAANLLLTFTAISGTNGIFQRTISVSQDLAVAMDQDLRQSVLKLGKALNDPIRGVSELREVGISFSDAQIATIKVLAETNRLAEAQTIVLDELDRQFGGSAETLRSTFGGAVTAASNAWGQFLAQVGLIVTNNPAVREAIGAVSFALEDLAMSLSTGEGRFGDLRDVANSFIGSIIPGLLRGFASLIDALQGTGGFAAGVLKVAESLQWVAVTAQRLTRTYKGLFEVVAAGQAWWDEDYTRLNKLLKEYDRQERLLDDNKAALAEMGAAMREASAGSTEAGDAIREVAERLEQAHAAMGELSETGRQAAALAREFQSLEEQVRSLTEHLDGPMAAVFEESIRNFRGVIVDAFELSGEMGVQVAQIHVGEMEKLLGAAKAALADARSATGGAPSTFDPGQYGVDLGPANANGTGGGGVTPEALGVDPDRLAAQRTSATVSAVFESAAGGFEKLDVAAKRWTQGLRADLTGSLLDPIFGAQGAMADLFQPLHSVMRSIGEAINDNLVKPLVDGIKNFFVTKTAEEAASTAASESIHQAAAASTFATTKATTVALMPGLSAAATAALIATFGGAGAAAGLLPGLLAAGAGTGLAAVAAAGGGRFASPTHVWLGEAAEEWVIPTANPGVAGGLLADMFAANPAIGKLFGGGRSSAGGGGGGRPIEVNVYGGAQTPEQIGRGAAREIDRHLGRLGG